MKKLSSVFLILIMLLVLVLTGCGAAKSANGDIPVGAVTKSVTDSASMTEDGGAQKSNGQSPDQQPTNTQATPGSQVPSTQPSQSDQPKADSKASKSTSAISLSSSNGSTAGQSAVPVPTPPAAVANTAAKNTVTFSIDCQTFIDKGFQTKEEFKDAVPANGIILPPTVLEFKEGQVVFDVLKQVVRERKIHMEYEGSKGTPYIQGISNLYEFDGGPLSGWMYCVNKIYPNYGCGEYKLKPGDVIEWNYTCDLGKDLGQTWLGESK